MIARRVLAVPSTSMPSERIFSAAGLLIRNKKQTIIFDRTFFKTKTVFHYQDIKKDTTESDFANVIGM